MENLDTISSRNFVRIQVRGGSNSSYSLVKDSHPLASLSDGEEDHILSWTEGLTWDELFDFIASQEEVPLTCPKEELEADDLFAIYNNKSTVTLVDLTSAEGITTFGGPPTTDLLRQRSTSSSFTLGRANLVYTIFTSRATLILPANG